MAEPAPTPAVGAVATRPAGDMVVVRDVTRRFGSGRTAVRALRGVSLTVPRGHLVVVSGRSGSGT